MFNKNYRLESLPSRKRYLYGKQMESLIIKCLKGYGYEIKDVDHQTDAIGKIDCYIIEGNNEKACQIKCRMGYSGDDILIDLYEPYYDKNHKKEGRDYEGKYDYYICLSKDGSTIRIINGERQKAIIEQVRKEWEDFNEPIPVYDSVTIKGVQIRYTIDKANGRPKILMFIKPSVYENDEIKTFEMIYPK